MKPVVYLSYCTTETKSLAPRQFTCTVLRPEEPPREKHLYVPVTDGKPRAFRSPRLEPGMERTLNVRHFKSNTNLRLAFERQFTKEIQQQEGADSLKRKKHQFRPTGSEGEFGGEERECFCSKKNRIFQDGVSLFGTRKVGYFSGSS